MTLPLTDKQILEEHSGLIQRVVMHCNNPGSVTDLELVLKQAEENGWEQLVNVIRRLMNGNREESLLQGLDHEDSVIVQSILSGLQDPNTLPDMQVDFASTMTAPGVAGLVYASRNDNAQARQLLNSVAKQMLQVGGDMAILAKRISPLVKGERNKGKLSEMMSENGQKLMEDIVDEVLRLDSLGDARPSGE